MKNRILVAAMWLAVFSAFSQTQSKKEYTVFRGNAEVKIDGVLNEEVWQNAQTISLDYETEPGNNNPSEVATLLRIAFDSENLYFSFEASDPKPKSIRAIINDRDKLDDNDFVSFFIDPFNDSRRAFFFSVNPLGVQQDGIYDEQESDGDLSWDAIWKSGGRITNEGYTVEASIPFKSLRFPGTDKVQTWRFFGNRTYPRSIEKVFNSMPVDQGNNCLLCQADMLTGLEGINPGRNLEFVPAVTVNRFDERTEFPEDDLEKGKTETNVGLDVRWGVTTDLALNFTLNPDFSQVEADAAQLDVNNRFSLQFPEKRPFFLEGADFFNTPLQAFFSRTIADPSYGVKLTGKVKKNAVGLLVARDQVNNLIIPGFQSSENISLDQEVTNVVGRYRRDVGRNSNVGLLITDREAGSYYNRAGGIDFFLRPWDPLTIRAQYMHTETRYDTTSTSDVALPSKTLSGDSFNFRASYETRNWESFFTFENRSKDFRADMGFVPQVDFRRYRFMIMRTFWAKDGSWYRNIRWNTGGFRRQSQSGQVDITGFWMSGSFNGPLQLNLWINPDMVWQQFDGETYRLDRLWTGFDIQPMGNLGFNGFFSFGPAVDFANSRKADGFQFRLESDIRIGRHIDMTMNHRLLRLREGANQVLTANLSQWQAAYNFNPRTFLRLILQYRHTLRNPELYEDTTVNSIDEAIFAQVLLSYKLNPQSVVFLGYVDNHQGWEGSEEPRSLPLLQLNQALFFKVGYAWRP
ncbi:MAG: DUF5916 domain-containing protein [Cyclobacteriaceae bacterium]